MENGAIFLFESPIYIKMVLDKLGDSLKNALSKVKNSITVDRTLVESL